MKKVTINFILFFTLLFFSSTDAFTQWAKWVRQNSPTTTVQINAVHFSSDQIGIAVGNTGWIYRTTNAGITWTSLQFGSSAGTGFKDNNDVFYDGTTWWIARQDSLSGTNGRYHWNYLKSTDDGVTWTTGYLDFTREGQFGDPFNNLRVFSTTVGTTKYVWLMMYQLLYYSTNEGTSWIKSENAPGNNQDIFFMTGTTRGWIATTNIDGNNINDNSTNLQNWYNMKTGSDANTNSVFFIDVANGWAVGENSSIRKASADWGTNTHDWQQSGTTAPVPGMSLKSVCFTDANNGTIVGTGGTIWGTTNSGTDWVVKNNTSVTQDLYNVFFVNGNNGWATGGAGTILKYMVAPSSLISTNITSTGADFSWLSVNGAQSYNLQISTSSTFSSLATSQNLASTSSTISSLSNNTNYYWRVSSQSSGGDTVMSVSGTFTTTGNAPVLSKPVNDSVRVSTLPLLTWNASANATKYYIRWRTSTGTYGAGSGLDSVTNLSTSYAMPFSKILTASTKYYWQVGAWDAESGNGTLMDTSTSSWSTQWSFTTSIPVPTPLLTPANGNTNQAANSLITFNWTAAANADGYRIQIDTTTNFNSVLLQNQGAGVLETGTSASRTVTVNNQRYFWRVQAVKTGPPADTSAWSEVFSFTTIVQAPIAPVLSKPVTDSVRVSTVPLLTWNASARATKYYIRWRLSSAANYTVAGSGLDSTTNLATFLTTTTTLQSSTKYSWQVGAWNIGSGTGTGLDTIRSAWSTQWSFTTSIPVPTPLVNPTNDTLDVPVGIPIWFRWTSSGTSPAITKYRIQVDTTTDFDSRSKTTAPNALYEYVKTNVSPDTTFFTFNTYNKKYFWRVEAIKDGPPADTSAWSEIFSFTTGIPSPVIKSPISNAKTSTNPTLVWYTVVGASDYQVQIYEYNGGALATSTVRDTSTQLTTWQVGNPLTYNVQYWWRVRARNTGGYSPWSVSSNPATNPYDPTFTPDPSIPTLLWPKNSQRGVALSPTLLWNPATSNITGYHVQVSRDVLFSSGNIVSEGNSTATNYPIAANILKYDSIYYWRVYSIGTYNSEWSDVWSFQTTLQAPVPYTPVNDSLVSVSPTLTWSLTLGAGDYRIAIYTGEPPYSVPAVRYFTTTGNQTNLSVNPALTAGQSYYWSIQAYKDTISSDWSHVAYWRTPDAKFTTTNIVPQLIRPVHHDASVSPSSVYLVWNSIPGEIGPGTNQTTYEIHLSKYSDFSSNNLTPVIHIADGDQTNLDSVSFTLDGSYAQPYYWRVRAIINNNNIGPWSETWTFTTGLPVPVLVLPVPEGQVSIQPTLVWNNSAGATDYDVQVYIYDDYHWYNDAVNGLHYITGTNTQATSWQVNPELLFNQWYQWRVRAHRTDMYSNNVYSAWTSYIDFSPVRLTKVTTNTLGVIPNPSHTHKGTDSRRFYTFAGIPTPYSPPMDSTSVSLLPTLRWYRAPDAQDYQYEVVLATDNAFEPSNIKQTYRYPADGNNPQFTNLADIPWTLTTPLEFATTYYWKVRANGSVSGWSPWSFVSNFTTGLIAPKPKLPIKDGTVIPTVSTMPTLEWELSLGATDYEIMVYEGTETGQTGEFVRTILATNLTKWIVTPALTNNKIYWWMVRAHAVDINKTPGEANYHIYSQWSNQYLPYQSIPVTAVFRTDATIPNLKAPSNGQIGVSSTPLLEWYSSVGAVQYELQWTTELSTNPTTGVKDFVNYKSRKIENSPKDNPNTFYQILSAEKLTKETQYYWRVRATNSSGWTNWQSGWSSIWAFQVTGAKLVFSYDPTGQFVAGSPSINNDVIGEFKYDSTVVGNTKTQTIYIKNEGDQEVLWASLNFNCTSGGFSTTVLTNTQIIINPGVTKAVPINFTPTSPGIWTCTLEVIHNDAANKNNPAKITLTGIAVQTKARLVVAPVNFGTVVLLSGLQEKIIALKNNSDVPGDYLVINELKFHNSPETLFTYVDPFPIYIAPGATFNLRVRFNPIERITNYTNNLHILNSSLNRDVTSLLSASTRDGNLHIEPLSWNFGVNPTDKEKTVKIMNYASKAITITAKVITGDPESYDLTNNTPVPITLSPGAPGGTDEFIMNFAPHTVGKKDAVIEITCDDTETSKYYISFTGINGTGPVIAATPNPIDFGTVSIGSTKDTTIIIENKGASDLVISKKQFTGDAKALFSFVTGGDAVTITSGDKKEVKIRLTASGNVGAFTAQLEMLSNDPTNPSYKINLSGTLNSRSISTNLDKIIFDTIVVGYDQETTFTITNNGNLDLSVSGIAVDGNHATDFTLRDAPQFPVLLTPGSQQVIKLRFAPSAAGTRLGRLIIYNSSEFNKEKVIVMRGYGKVVHAGIAVTPNPLDFGSISNSNTKTMELVISNLSAYARLSINSFSFAEIKNMPFSFGPLSFPIIIEPSSSYKLIITFAPNSTTRSYVTFLTINSNAVPDSVLKVQVVGRVDMPGALIQLPPVLDFGKVVVNTSKTLPIPIINTGTSPLIIQSLSFTGADTSEFSCNIIFPLRIDQDETVKINITWSPKKVGFKSAEIQLKWNDLINNGVVRILAECTLSSGQTLDVKSNEVPTVYSLSQNYPNPFNPSTKIEFGLPENTYVKVLIYNSIGQEISILVNQSLSAGNYVFDWHTENLPSGIYFYKMITEKFSSVKKMLYLR